MRIRAGSLIVDENLKQHRLSDSTLVIDAQNFFYDYYEESKLNVYFGAECDRYATYLKQKLSMFKKSNIKCYFIFKGGTKNLQDKILKEQMKNQDLNIGSSFHPIFMNDVSLQVLQEMEFDYIFTEYEAKTICIGLARHLSCPVISMDIEFAFSGVNYIPKSTIQYQENKKTIDCKMFSLNDFFRKYNLNKRKMAIFILLTEESFFGERSNAAFFCLHCIVPYPGYKQNKSLLYWLSKTPERLALQAIIENSIESKELILEKLKTAEKFVDRDSRECARQYLCLLSKKYCSLSWFEEGVALTIINKEYIDVYRSEILLVTDGQENNVADNPVKLSLKIIKYAYDLLTDFQNVGIKFIPNYNPNSEPVLVDESIKKPPYQARQTVFENGWDNIKSLDLFQHFFIEEIDFKFEKLNRVPVEAKLLLLALVYFHHKKSGNTHGILYGVLLSYVTLGVINANYSVFGISESDSKAAAESLQSYFNVTVSKITKIRNIELPYPFLEFQQCLKEINYLNKLCGSPFEPTIYSKTFNATFIYKIVHSIQKQDESLFLNKVLASAPSVLRFVNNMIEHYKNLLV